MDGVDPADIQAARDAALAVDGVEDVAVRGRWMGRSLVLEVEARLIQACLSSRPTKSAAV